MIDGFLKAWFALFCHQLPDRCLCFGGQSMPLCARCTGLYTGAALVGTWLLGWLWRRQQPWVPRRCLVASALVLGMCLLDGVSGASHAWELGNVARFLLGLGAGIAGVPLVATWLRRWFPDESVRYTEAHAPTGLLVAAATLALLTLTPAFPAVGLLLGMACFAGLSAYLTMVICACLELIRRVLPAYRFW